jgi:hypothetical protein
MLVVRMIRAAKLDPDLYYEVQRDQKANKQAFTITGKAIQAVLVTTVILFLIDLIIGLPFSGIRFLLASLGLHV